MDRTRNTYVVGDGSGMVFVSAGPDRANLDLVTEQVPISGWRCLDKNTQDFHYDPTIEIESGTVH